MSNSDAGLVNFRINVPNRPTLTGDMLIALEVDSDNNAATGSTDGTDYAIEIFQGQAALYRWDGAAFTRRPGDPPATSLVFSYAGGATLQMSATELGNTRAFRFGVVVISGVTVNPSTGGLDFTNALADFAPAVSAGLYAYQVLISTPPPPPQPGPEPEARTYQDASHLPSRIRYVGNSIKHVRLGEKLYDTMQRLQREGLIRVPRVVAVACWSKSDWPGVVASAGFEANPNLVAGFFLGRVQPRWLHVAPKQCSDVQALMLTRASNGQRAYALATVLHERVHAEGVSNEAETNCYGVQLVYDFALELNFVPSKALRLEQLAVRKSRQVAPRNYWNAAKCRDGGAWDLYPQFINLSY